VENFLLTPTGKISIWLQWSLAVKWGLAIKRGSQSQREVKREDDQIRFIELPDFFNSTVVDQAARMSLD
jgi:hypothetical protein